MKKLALLLSLLALGALGLVACGGGDDDEATAASGPRPRMTATHMTMTTRRRSRRQQVLRHRWRLGADGG